MKVGFYTLGCKVSQYETEAVAEAFERAGYTIAPFDDICDVYVINTCTVTAESDRKCRQMIRRATGRSRGAIVCVMGCYSQTAPAELAAIAGVDIVIGNSEKLSLVSLVEQKRGEREQGRQCLPTVAVSSLIDASFESMKITRAPRTRAYVKIEDGCECRCTYCAIPAARGPVRSKLPEDVVAEVEGLSASGVCEIVLTGIETASYGVDFGNGYRLADLLLELDRRGSAKRIRLGSLTPELMREEFVSKIKGLSSLVPHFHLSMQSGCDRVLRDMKRRYNTQMAKDALARLREAIPRVEFTTDLMVGFPGESEEDFEQTLAFVRECRFLDIHVFAYSRRPNTPAAEYKDQIPEAVKRERSARLIALKNEIRDEILNDTIAKGEPLSVILETEEGGKYHAHADTFMELLVDASDSTGDLSGEMRDVLPLSHKNGIIFGKLI